jgi:predicted dehydrogenase
MSEKVRVLVVGLGNMGLSHAKAYHALPGFEIVGLCSRNIASISGLPAELEGYARFADYTAALADLKPDAVSINTYSDTHADFAIQAFEADAHVFLEKPIAETLEDARRVVDTATRLGKKLVVGYILRHHPSWAKLVDVAQGLGKPLVMRMNLNQQSSGATWETHKTLMKTMSPVVDCGVHYVDMMCLMARAKPVKVHAMGVNLTPEIDPDMYNYGQLQVFFDDGSVGWYEAGWGPMMSETAFFIKDVVGPNGCVSIVAAETAGEDHKSDDVDSHTKTSSLRLHFSDMDSAGNFDREDETINTEDEPGHDDLCQREQEYFLNAIVHDVDLASHMDDAANSLAIVLAADRSIRNGEIVYL